MNAREALLARLRASGAGGLSTGSALLRQGPERLAAARARASRAQQGIFVATSLSANPALYNVIHTLRLSGGFDPAAWAQSVDELTRRHESLRTRFELSGGELWQVIDPPRPWSVDLEDLTAMADGVRDAALAAILTQERNAPFELATGPLLRLRLLKLRSAEHLIVVSLHHIVTDGWSMAILMRELNALYLAAREGRPSPLAEPRLQYADYAAWEETRDSSAGLDYWRATLADAPVLQLPTDRPVPATPSQRGRRLRAPMPPGFAARVSQLARRLDTTMFNVLLAGSMVVLRAWSGQDDICIGVPVANRATLEARDLVGVFVNQVVLRADVRPDLAFAALVDRLKVVSAEALAHQHVRFEDLVAELAPNARARPPLFQAGFNFVAELTDPATSQLAAGSLLDLYSDAARVDLEFVFENRDGELQGQIVYAADLFDEATMARLADHLVRLLEQAAEDPARPVGDLEMLSPDERRQLLEDWNDTAVDTPAACLHTLVEAQATRTPDAVAVVCGEEHLTYAALNAQANRLARHLQTLGVGPDVVVGLCLERSLDMVVALLAILKAGGAYLPLDPDYPTERLAFMLQDAAAPVLITTSDLEPRLGEAVAVRVLVDMAADALATQPDTPPPCAAAPDTLAYVIYTSGSTGRPKGVMVQHRAVGNYLRWRQDARPVGPADRVLQNTTFSFDVSVWQFFLPLLNGAAIVLPRPGGHRDPRYLSEVIETAGVTVAHFVPSMLQAFLQGADLGRCGGLRTVVTSGEALPGDVARHLLAKLRTDLINLYGPTEAAIDVTGWDVRADDGGGVPIGRPIANTAIYVLDRTLAPVPIGVAGEIQIAGAGLARGYLGRPGLTAERFVACPFGGPGERMYRTGDLGRWRADGVLEYLGRLDGQVKLRGHRIELGEIESVLSEDPTVRRAAAILREDVAGEPRLVAYVTGQADAAPDIAALRAHLARRLPDHMVPSAIVVLDALPLTPNGKLDRKALPAFVGPRPDTAMVAPRTPTEQALAEIWAEVLGVETVGVQHSFFDLGGHSLMATRVITRIRDVFDIEVSLMALFEARTIEALAEHLLESLLMEDAS
jgi:amino acid adenylation domain-containing protein